MSNKPTIPEVMGTLDELGAAVRAHDAQRYHAALSLARRQELTQEQIGDAYTWSWPKSRRGAPPFDVEGNPRP